ncbi:MAG: alpha-L-fucosidase [Lentimicrobium sp.]|nr:alpha-L-fucosidase [Lentimicrobium sp.]
MKIFPFLRLLVFGLIFISLTGSAQHGDQQRYFWPEDSLVKEQLAWWQDLKFGLLMHWGPYSQWGVVESWSLCPEDEDWCTRRGPHSKNYFEYLEAYGKLPETFNPVKFNPEKWADAAARAGMKYMVFTTKHHDGFCMFDTKLTDYRITYPEYPYAADPKSDITGQIFNAFREKGIGIGAYFSKPDWHCPDYWDPYFPPMDRNPNYNLKKYPEKWQRYKEFTHGQIRELLTGYGDVDILWLDGGWVKKCTDKVYPDGKRQVNQDIDISALADMARELQPGILVVDRAVEGPEQNYLTPEQRIPEKPLAFPWETCMTMANSWSFVPNDEYKSSSELIHLLCKIVSRGGNFLLNIGPGPDGEWAREAYQRLDEIGEWMAINGEAIYGSRPLKPYQQGNYVYTTANGNLYVILLKEPGNLPDEFSFTVPEGFTIFPELMGGKVGLKVKKDKKHNSVTIRLDMKDKKQFLSSPALVFRFSRS